MNHSTFKLTSTLFILAVAAGPALAESPLPAPSPESAPAQVDAFGLPCEVTFAPKAATSAKPARGKRSKEPKATAAYTTSGLGRGGEFALGRPERTRGSSYSPRADAEVRMAAATVTPSMVSIVVRENAAALELCLTKMPRDARVATVGLLLTIEATGSVSSAKVTGAPSAPAFVSCLIGAAKTWAFPHTDAAVDIEYPIVLNAR